MKRPFYFCVIAFATLLVAAAPALAAAEQPADEEPQPIAITRSGLHQLRDADPNLTGEGVRFAVVSRSFTYTDKEPQNDYRPNISHNCFSNNEIVFHDGGHAPAGISPHSTAICSILLGEDTDAFYPNLGQFHYQGAAPQAQADVYEFWYFLINEVFPHRRPNADILTASIGNQSEDWWTRGIEALAEHYGLIVVAGTGNGSDAYDPLLYPGAGANVIGVGVVDSVESDDMVTSLSQFALAYPEHSSVGPTSDGRCKPDIVAPGNCLAADIDDPNRYEATGSWSSFSTPIVAGAIGLLVEKAKQDPNLNPAVSSAGGNCVIKAILLNSATKLPYWHKGRLEKDDDHQAPLDCIQGAGMLNAVGAYEHLTAGRNKPGDAPQTGWDLNHLEKRERPENTYSITVSQPAGTLITATAVWNRHFTRIYPFERIPEKDADLRLELWAVDPNDPNNDYIVDYSDSNTDNLEHIYCRTDANYTDYEIVLSFSDIEEADLKGMIARYGLAWNVSEPQDDDSIFWYDLNADGIVDDLDLGTLIDYWIGTVQTPNGYFLGDVNGNGEFDAADVESFLSHKNDQADWYSPQANKPD